MTEKIVATTSPRHLLRAAIISANGGPVEKGFQLGVGNVTVRTLAPIEVNGEPKGTLVVATVPLDHLEDRVLREPTSMNGERKAAEAAIELTARLVAVDRRQSFGIQSPEPCLGVSGLSTSQSKQLVGQLVAGLLPITQASALTSPDIMETSRLEELRDRESGIALLAEALNSTTAFGQYVQLLRLFEHAFRRNAGTLEGPLASFLAESSHGFSRREIRAWLRARGPSLHADCREEVFLEADLRPFAIRMMEAGYDVLFNKETWRDPSSNRRTTWKPAAGTNAESGSLFVTQGSTPELRFQVFDPFGSYPLLLAGGLTSPPLPRGVWLTHTDKGTMWQLLPKRRVRAQNTRAVDNSGKDAQRR